MPKSLLIHELFFGEPAGRFALGHVFRSTQAFAAADQVPASDDVGRWRCDITDHDKLTWTETVYELFGLPADAQVERDEAVARYSDHSRSVLERLRTFAITRGCGFILDAAIHPKGEENRWIRILAVPILENNRVVALQGLKRAL